MPHVVLRGLRGFWSQRERMTQASEAKFEDPTRTETVSVHTTVAICLFPGGRATRTDPVRVLRD
jgi:hypothetical protein